MNLVKEAAYLYVYSKGLAKINRKLRKHSKRAEKHRYKMSQTRNEKKKLRHESVHLKSARKIHKLMKKSDLLLAKLQHHYLNFREVLRQQETTLNGFLH